MRRYFRGSGMETLEHSDPQVAVDSGCSWRCGGLPVGYDRLQTESTSQNVELVFDYRDLLDVAAYQSKPQDFYLATGSPERGWRNQYGAL